MFAQLVGNVDWNSAAVLVAMFACVCVPLTAAIAKRRSRRELEMQFEIDTHKLNNADADAKRNSDRLREFELAKLATEKEVQYKRIDSGLIEGTRVVRDSGGD